MLQQCKIDRIGGFLETAKAEGVFIVADFVAEESGREKSKKDPFLVNVAKREILKRLNNNEDLSFVQIQRMEAMLYPGTGRLASAS